MTPTPQQYEFYESTLDCVHCGLCLPACPTYDLLGLETDSPRGRVHLMRAVAEGRIADPAPIRLHLDRCLGCRACESVCPSGVQYGAILESARGAIEAERPAQGSRAWLRRLLLRHVVRYQGRLRLAFRLARGAEVLGLRRLAEKLGLIPELTRDLVPAVPRGRDRKKLAGTFEPEGELRGTVALFTGCVMEQVFGDLNRKTLRLLRANGFRVVIPADQGCCGALHLHDGQRDVGRALAQKNLQAFGEFDVVIHNSAGCGAAMRDYEHVIDGGAALGTKVRDVCEFLAEQGLTATPSPTPARVAYDDPCHLCHGQGVRSQPRTLLEKVPGLELVPHSDSESCCGSAGIYNLNQPELAAAIGAAKAKSLIDSGAAIVATGNPGCIMQIRAHLRRRKSQTEAPQVMHPVELLLP